MKTSVIDKCYNYVNLIAMLSVIVAAGHMFVIEHDLSQTSISTVAAYTIVMTILFALQGCIHTLDTIRIQRRLDDLEEKK